MEKKKKEVETNEKHNSTCHSKESEIFMYKIKTHSGNECWNFKTLIKKMKENWINGGTDCVCGFEDLT